MHRFPPEILGHIFICCRDVDHAQYSFAVCQNAPMVLTHVCSLWRRVAHSTPPLWTTLRLPKSAFKDDGPPILPQMLERSRSLPLCITVETMPNEFCNHCRGRHIVRPDYGDRRWLDLVWAASHRLESINLHLTSGEPTSCLLPQQQAFSVLSSLTISMAGADEPQLSEILECFTNAPSLRSLKLRATHASESWLLANFPWSQLTNLNLDLPLLVESVRDFLVQCPTLQVAILPSLVGLNDENITAPLTPVYTLPKLRRLEVASKGDGLLFLLNSISLPALESLSLSTLENPPDAFLAPDLSLSVAALTPTELFSILRPLTATLRTLEIRKCRCITNDLFHDLKDASAGPEPLQLPELTTLTLHVVASLNTLDGDVVADTLDTLASARHRSDAPFPKLRTVGLYGLPYLQSESGQIEHVQRRLTALRRSGFLILA
ncbi:hypothetical protein C8R46DRAFT_1245848 [Mycena filopes]|nr:hypothetical protein C8R46DRAFT_1245848 [Mycena filopes]